MPKRSSSAVAVPTTAAKKTKTNPQQVEWGSIWEKYMSKVNHYGPDHVNSGQNSIYDLIVQVTRTSSTSNEFKNIDPCTAMYEAKKLHRTLQGTEESINAIKKNWRWSPQSVKARQYLAKHYGDPLPFAKFPSLSESAADRKKNVKVPPVKAFKAGWRMFCVPSPSTNSHNMRWFPPSQVAEAMDSSDLDLKMKKCPDLKVKYLTSPNVVKWLQQHEGTADLTLEERGK
jgi:hypothetical protein